MMENPSPKEENIIKGIRNLFIGETKIELIGTTMKDVKNFFRPEKENEQIKDRRISDITNVFRLEKQNKVIKNIKS